MSNSTIPSRLQEARAALDLSQRAFGEALGVSHVSVARWETGKTEVSLLTAKAIEQVWRISADWLLFGVGPMMAPARLPNPTGPFRDGVVLVPQIEGLPMCGPGGEIQDPGPDAPHHAISQGFFASSLKACGAGSLETLYFARVQGDSMVPTIRPGDLILVNTALPLRLEPKKGALHLVRKTPRAKEASVKRLYLVGDHLNATSDSATGAAIDIPINDTPIQDLVLGRVLWYGALPRTSEGTSGPF